MPQKYSGTMIHMKPTVMPQPFYFYRNQSVLRTNGEV